MFNIVEINGGQLVLDKNTFKPMRGFELKLALDVESLDVETLFMKNSIENVKKELGEVVFKAITIHMEKLG